MTTYRNIHSGRLEHRADPDPRLEHNPKWVRVEAEPGVSGVFDPGEHTVKEVNAHLADAGRGERERVLTVESEGRARTRILSGPHADLSGL